MNQPLHLPTKALLSGLVIVTVPESASCRVASVRIRVDFPAPFWPSSPYMPCGIVSVTSSSAFTPFAYVLDKFCISSSTK